MSRRSGPGPGCHPPGCGPGRRAGVGPAELGMEVSGVLIQVGQGVGDLVVEILLLFGQVGHRDLAALPERHRPVGVESAAGVNAYCQGADLGVPAPATGEEVADRTLHRRVFASIPIESQDGLPPDPGGRHPDVLDGAGTVDLCQHPALTGGDPDRGGYLPSRAQVACRLRPGPFRRHPASPRLAGEVLRAYRARPGVRQAV